MYGLCVQGSAFCVIHCCYPPVVHILAHILSVFLQEWSKVTLHGSLEEGQHIAHPEVHYFWNVSSMVCLDGCFVSILLGKSDVVIAMTNVKLEKQCLALEFIHRFLYPWHWVMVLDSPGIHSSVINDDMLLSTVLLANEEDRGDVLQWPFFNVS